MNIGEKLNKKGDKIHFFYDLGRGPGQRPSTGIFIYARPNGHLTCCLTKFKEFIKSDYISPVDITENFCKRFHRYLLDKFTGETPANYYARFKWVVKAAFRDSYFRVNPTEDLPAISNPIISLKEHLEAEEYIAL